MDLKCFTCGTQLCSQTAKYDNIVIRSISECPITEYNSDIT